MKRLFLILVVMVVLGGLLFASSAMAGEQRVMVDESGNVSLVEVEAVKRLLTIGEKEAYDNPGTEVPIGGKIVKWKKVSFFYRMPVIGYDEVVVFKDDKLSTIAKKGEEDGEKVFAIHLFIILVAIIFMVVSNMIVRNMGFDTATYFAIYAFAFFVLSATVFFVFSPFSFVASAVFITAIALAYVATVASKEEAIKAYKISSAIFYVVAVMALFM